MYKSHNISERVQPGYCCSFVRHAWLSPVRIRIVARCAAVTALIASLSPVQQCILILKYTYSQKSARVCCSRGNEEISEAFKMSNIIRLRSLLALEHHAWPRIHGMPRLKLGMCKARNILRWVAFLRCPCAVWPWRANHRKAPRTLQPLGERQLHLLQHYLKRTRGTAVHRQPEVPVWSEQYISS
jgi:hypothetical protein